MLFQNDMETRYIFITGGVASSLGKGIISASLGKLLQARRTFGICLGMQMMVIEFARNVLGYADANSSEMDPVTPHNVIDMMEEQKNILIFAGISARSSIRNIRRRCCIRIRCL